MNCLISNPGRCLVGLAVALTCAGWLCGCTPSPRPDAPPVDPDLPDIAKLRSRLPAQMPTDSIDRGPTARVRITHMVFPADSPLNAAWRLAKSKGVEPPFGALWRANGLCVYLVHRNVLDEFFALMPEPVSLGEQGLLASRLPAPVQVFAKSTKGRRRSATVVLPGDREEELTVDRGMCRFLLQAQPEDDGTVFVHLTPQHHRPCASILPRTRMERQLDGRVFDELSLQAKLGRGHVLLIGLTPQPGQEPQDVVEPEPSDTTPPDAASAEPAGSGPDEPEAPPSEDDVDDQGVTPIGRPRRIGELILGTSHEGRRAQLLLAIVAPNAKSVRGTSGGD